MKAVRVWVLGLVWGLSMGSPVEAAWKAVEGLPEAGVLLVVPIEGGRGRLAVSDRQVYRHTDDTPQWKRVAGVRSPDQILDVTSSLQDPKTLWMLTRRSIRRSLDGGRHWKIVYRRDSESGFQLRALRTDDAGRVWVGTTSGLFQLLVDEGRLASVTGPAQNASVESLVYVPDPGFWMAATSRGIYRISADGQRWELAEGQARGESSSESEGVSGQFSIEEIAVTPVYANAVIWPGDRRIYLGRLDGLYEASADGRQIRKLAQTQGSPVRRLAADERYVYAATDRGVLRVEPKEEKVESLSDGLSSLDVRGVAFDPSSKTLWAGTVKGIFQMPATDSPEVPASITPLTAPAASLLPVSPVTAALSSEPTIAQIQQAAIHYAEVSPDKIKSWRESAARKAWLPTVSFDTDIGEDQNVDIDRGGTNDPDKFIIGPKESTFDWSVGVSWDLGDLIWNDDQTSIDVRSRLMVELRNDILNDVTHLYFERRRAQLELAGLPSDVPRLKIEKELKVQELTAQIDALTGGYLSRHLSGAGHAQS